MNQESFWSKLRLYFHWWFWPLLSSFILFVFTFLSFYQFHLDEEAYLKDKSQEAAKSIAKILTSEIEHRTSVLKVLGQNLDEIPPKAFVELAETLIREYPGFFGINRINAKGVIVEVFPKHLNQAALGKNLLERSDVKNYLMEARETKQTRMSHRLITYQGIPAFTLYIPLYRNSGEFLGWLNAVVDFDKWTENFLKENNYQNTRLKITWDHTESGMIDEGTKHAHEFFRYPEKILNQHLTFLVGFSPDDIELNRHKQYQMIILVAVLLLFISSMLVILVNVSRLKVEKLNNSLQMKNNLLSSLCHDLATPLSILNLNLANIFKDATKSISAKTQTSLERSIKTMMQMLDSVRVLHAQDMGVMQVNLSVISILDAVRDAIVQVNYLADFKKVRLEINNINPKTTVSVEPITFVNNVLINILTNAVKFSPENGLVEVKCELNHDYVILIIEDEGSGLSLKQAEELRSEHKISSHKGTNKEQGTGLGLIQIKGFMKLYNGTVEMKNKSPHGCAVHLYFPRQTN